MARWRESLLALALALIVLAPYVAVLVTFQAGLRLQLAIIVAAVVAGSAATGTGFRPKFLPHSVRLGLFLYAAAALWGLVVGLASGNPSRYVASQSASMLLLPLAAAALAGVPRSGRLAVAGGAAAAVPVALGLHGFSLAFPNLELGDPLEPFRLLLRNDASLTGAAPLLSCLLLGSWLASRRLWALAAWLLSCVLVIGIMSRGGWLVAFAGMAGTALVMARRRRRVIAALALGLGGLAVVWLLLTARSLGSPQTIFDSGASGERTGVGRPWCVAVASTVQGVFVPLVERLDPQGAGVEIVVDYRGPAEGRALLVVDGTPANASPSPSRLTLFGSGAAATLSELVPLRELRPPIALSFFAAEGQGEWVVHRLRVLEARSQANLYLRQLNTRLVALWESLAAPMSDRNLGYRARELRAVVSQWRSATSWRRLIGHGLGATISFPNSSWDEHGRRITIPTASYIHNFYVFLGFKLGIAGAAALAGLILILAWAWRESAGAADDISGRWPVVVLAVGLTVYLVWSVTSPEVYDFRVAPLWGVMIAVSAASTVSAWERGGV